MKGQGECLQTLQEHGGRRGARLAGWWECSVGGKYMPGQARPDQARKAEADHSRGDGRTSSDTRFVLLVGVSQPFEASINGEVVPPLHPPLWAWAWASFPRKPRAYRGTFTLTPDGFGQILACSPLRAQSSLGCQNHRRSLDQMVYWWSAGQLLQDRHVSPLRAMSEQGFVLTFTGINY
ncbi:hypothetical protein AXG93_3911s1190 [Marchantia polymorpha subsp. ruderalis]|uniref:Uncharacterized protein n=1 Tax=Marchantia polymorpha subsp. ruderalis TaxID=1480154 RepID=A0A176W2Z4_MARPO|nr:hypothetical protein AXG93_3911s1190 [Marchantia polymorpha subsp. ruderalis]